MTPRQTRKGTILEESTSGRTTRSRRATIASADESINPPNNNTSKISKRKQKKIPVEDLTDTAKDESNANTTPRKSRRRAAPAAADTVTESPEEVSTPQPSKKKTKSIVETESATNVENIEKTVTPKSSPIVVNLTPHRSTKTPRKSPVNLLTSPKSATPLRLSKTPRKLPVTEKTPTPEKSPPTSANESYNDLFSTNSTNSSQNSSPNKREKKKKKSSHSKSKKSSNVVRKFSKSPKIVLKEPKAKNKKLKSPKVNNSTKKEQVVQKKTSPKRSPSPQKKQNDDSADSSTLNNYKSISESKNPRVMIEKLPSNGYNTSIASPASSKKSKRSKIQSPVVVNTPVSSPKRSKSNSAENSMTESHIGSAVQPFVASTPRVPIERSAAINIPSPPSIRRSTATTTTTSPIGIRTRHKGDSIEILEPIIANTAEKSGLIDEESDPLLYDSYLMNMTENVSKKNVTFDKETTVIDEDDKAVNTTYEVLEPKTPDFRNKMKSKKRNSAEVDLNNSHENAKKVCKVRFAISVEDIDDDKTKSHTEKVKKTPTASKAILNRSSSSSSSNDSKATAIRRRSNSMPSMEIKKSSLASAPSLPETTTHRRSRSFSELRVNKSINKSSNPSVNNPPSVGKKSNDKTLSAKKAPNFAQIHQKKFNEMESVLDAKKRVQERHKLLTKSASKEEKSNKVVPNQPTNGPYNRFGFKLRKDDAVKMVAKRPSISKTNNTETNRTILKGVRMNRRFELQMKARKINV